MPPSPEIAENGPTADGLLAPVRRRYEPHTPGLLYLLITIFLAIGAINSQNNLLFLAFGLAIAGLLLSGLVSGAPLMHVAARRRSPPTAHVGEHVDIRYRVVSRGGRFSAMGLEIRELTDGQGGVPGGGRLIPAAVLWLRPGEDRLARGRLHPDRRGRHELTGFAITSTFPFGLLRKTLIFEQPQALVVAPRRIALRGMPWQRAGRDGATLSAVTSRRGSSTEFYALRGYVPGDPPRRIAWKPSARAGELVVREEAASAPPRIWIRVDEPDDGAPPHLIERGAALVAALAHDAAQAGFAVGLAGQGVGLFRPFSGPRQVKAIQTAMATLGERGPSRPGSDHRADGDRRSLKVRVQYRGGGRARAGSEFRLSADDLSLWFRGPQVPPEFVERDGAGAANGVRDRLRRGREGLMARAGLKGTTA